VRAILLLIESESSAGAFNLTAPEPATNAEFTRTLAQVLGRPTFLRVPAFALRLLLGELAELLLLGGQRVIPQRLEQAGFRFHFPQLELALRHLLLKNISTSALL
jgi:NAD dependent epimerase/dehydratase family enzyme